MRKTQKAHEVSKFGGVDNLGSIREENVSDAPVSNFNTDLQSLEVKSDTNIESDDGHGKAAIVRMFEFGINPEAFKRYKDATGKSPSKQELFNSFYKGIEVALWRDGLKVIPEADPKVVIDSKNGKFRIFVGAEPMKGHILREKPQTLKQIVHG